MRVEPCAIPAPRPCCRHPYHGSGGANLFCRFSASSGVLLAVLIAAGCSMSMPIASLIPGAEEKVLASADADKRDITGSLPLQPPADGSASGGMTPVDWSLAATALREALNRSDDATSILWQNPTSGARGTVTPIAAAYVQDGFPCRNFLASHVHAGREIWFEGTACRVHRGQWDIRSTRPLQKS